MARSLSPAMTVREFATGYWYLTDLKAFAVRIGIPAANRLRKDELEKAIVAFLRTGRAALPTRRSLRKTGMKDLARGLSPELPIRHYTSNRATKDFIVAQAHRIAPDVREKSGVWYRLNRWREAQITGGRRPTYGDLVRKYIALTRADRFDRIPHGRYINFVAEFLAAESGATHRDAVAAWHALKSLDIPKTYAAWAEFNRRGKRARANVIRTKAARRARRE